jgi:hypothetical protein
LLSFSRGATPALLLVTLSVAAGTATPASAYYYGDPYRRSYWQPAPRYYDPYNPYYGERLPPRPAQRSRPIRKKENVERPLSNAEKQADGELKAKVQQGPLHVLISIDNQSLGLYSNGTLIARSKVSTGVPGHPTPTGVFSVIQKRRFHTSNIYSGAPMPYMQRITWSGIALHQGIVPGRPASHGCIRLPEAFARQLWGISKIGTRVIITRGEITPAPFEHARLFVAKAATEQPVASAPPRREGVRLAEASPIKSDATGPEQATDASKPSGDELKGSMAETAVQPGNKPAVADAPADAPQAPDKVAEKPLRAGPISVFVSRKEGKVFVRKGFQPVFDAPVTIERPEAPLGTHVFTAMARLDNGLAMRWNAMTLPTSAERKADPAARAAAKRAGNAAPAPKPPEPIAVTPAEALDRVTIPPEALDRISSLMTPGATLIVSDQGLGYETGLETDFVILTR